jgi:hypothetical protein
MPQPRIIFRIAEDNERAFHAIKKALFGRRRKPLKVPRGYDSKVMNEALRMYFANYTTTR